MKKYVMKIYLFIYLVCDFNKSRKLNSYIFTFLIRFCNSLSIKIKLNLKYKGKEEIL